MLKFLIVAAMVTASLGAASQTEPSRIPHGTVEFVSAVDSIRPGSDFRVGLLFRLEPGWHIYWKNPGDSGQPPRILWQLPTGFSAGEIEWPAPKRLPVGPLLDYGYEGEVLLPIPIRTAASVPLNSSQTLSGNLRVLVCRETCMPGKAALSLTLPVRKIASAAAQHADLFTRALELQPGRLPADWKVSGEQDKASIWVSISGIPKDAKVSFIPAQPNVIENAGRQELTADSSGLKLKLKKPADSAENPRELEGLLYSEEAGKPPAAYTMTALLAGSRQNVGSPLEPRGQASTGQSLVAILALAFGGGLILNLMPCVFPVLSLKVLSLLDHSQGEKRTIRISAALYTAGILMSFWLLVAALLTLRAAGRSLGWGFQLQAPGFVAFLVCLLFVLGLSLIGAFEIGASLMNTGGSLTQRGKYSSSFFTGVLATIVATPCTAPLMGVAVGFALGQPPFTCVVVFTTMAIGLASPFLLLSLFPELSRFLPRPGAWMETLKQVMAFPVFATVIWLLWVLGQQVGVNQLAILLFSLLILSLAGWMAGRWPRSRWMKVSAILLGIAVTAYVSTGLTPETRVLASTSRESEGASGLKWEPFSAEKLASYRAMGKPVLIDFTAAWCLTCQVNDRVVFHSPTVQKHLNGLNIALLRADWTSYDPAITNALAQYGRSGIPFYVVYGAKQDAAPVTLPDGLLTPSGFLENLKKADL